nr:MAG TPA: hypothetical protein [Caudoviricetes sp.]
MKDQDHLLHINLHLQLKQPLMHRQCTQPLNMRNIKTNRDWAGIFGNKRDEYR